MTNKLSAMPRNTILDIYLAQLKEKGPKVNVTEIARKIGVPQASLWRAFRGVSVSDDRKFSFETLIKLEQIGFFELPENVIVINTSKMGKHDKK